MIAYVVESAGGPFRAVEMPTPQPASDQVLVKILASDVNPLDTKIRAGEGGHAKQPLPAVLGMDMAGVVVTVGAGVTAFRPGDEGARTRLRRCHFVRRHTPGCSLCYRC
jgi:NADPH:quinone reductase